MRITIERLRAVVLTGAGLLLVLLGAFLGYAHLRAHTLLHDLPGRLGADIQKETNGITWSQTVQGRTIFTLHAARATQRRDGTTALHDVGIVLYGQQGDRADRIYGKDFDYDQAKGEVRATGEVQLDLQAQAPTSAAQRSAYAAGGQAVATGRRGADELQPVHVITSGLVYQQRLGTAATEQPIRFEYRGFTGQAKGATFNSGTGVTTLESEIRISGTRNGRPAVLTASHGEMNRAQQTLALRSARYVVVGGSTRGAETRQELGAGEVLMHLGADSRLESVDGSNGVDLTGKGGVLHAAIGNVQMNRDGRPETAHMSGELRFATSPAEGDSRAGTSEGEAGSGVAHFDGRRQVETIDLLGGVMVRSHGGRGEERALSGHEMQLRFAGKSAGPSSLSRATAIGEAKIETVVPARAGKEAVTEEVSGDTLVADTRPRGRTTELQEVTGKGHTEIQRVAGGVKETSRGDTLDARFAPAAGRDPQDSGTVQITSAVQRGAVLFTREAPTKDGGVEQMRGAATEASLDGESRRVTLSGKVEVFSPGEELRADRLLIARESGDAEASGSVQVTYRQQRSRTSGNAAGAAQPGDEAEPMHVVSARGVFRQTAGLATFYGAEGADARLWQGGSQVEAPMLVLSRQDGSLDAFGLRADDNAPVHTVLATEPKASESTGRRAGRPEVARIASRRLHYSNTMRQAEFSGGVLLVDPGGSMSSHQAVATLLPATGPGAAEQASPAVQGKDTGRVSSRASLPSFGGGLERVVATGDVAIRQPGREATGEQALYTASDGVVVLTGTGLAPPRVTDAANGTLTGGSLRFRAGDNSVVVEGRARDSGPVSPDGRVHTTTRVRQ